IGQHVEDVLCRCVDGARNHDLVVVLCHLLIVHPTGRYGNPMPEPLRALSPHDRPSRAARRVIPLWLPMGSSKASSNWRRSPGADRRLGRAVTAGGPGVHGGDVGPAEPARAASFLPRSPGWRTRGSLATPAPCPVSSRKHHTIIVGISGQ